MKTLIARRIHDALGVTVYTECVPQNMETPSVSVFPDRYEFEGEQNGWTVCRATFRLIVREVPIEAVAQAVTSVPDRMGQVYRAEEMRAEEDFFVTFRYRARVEETREDAPMMQTMTQKTEV